MELVDLTVEGERNPLGIDDLAPRFSWRLADDGRGIRQASYRIQVAADEARLITGIALLVDTEECRSPHSHLVECRLPVLGSRRSYAWRVQVRDTQGRLSEWSAPQRWEMGLLDKCEWSARWISPREYRDRDVPSPAPYLRRSFNVRPGLVRARAYMSAQGLYAARINGERIGDAVLTPGWTSYHDRIQYQTYDITDALVVGENVVGVMLGDGWFRGSLWPGPRNRYGEHLALLCQIELFYADGTSETIGTERDNWTCSTGAILSSELYAGEVQDARLEPIGWDRPGFDASEWSSVIEAPEPRGRLIAQSCPPVRRIEERAPISVERLADGQVIIDMGQNMVGWTRLRASGPAGTTITVRHAELLQPDGSLYTENLQAAVQTDRFTLRGEGEEIFEPHFTFHGFRYVSVEGYPGELTPDAITGIVCHSDLTLTGEFECSEPLVNQLQSNILWSQRGNFVDIPTDCPQRAERMGWTADVQLFAPTAAFNMDVRRFLSKWLEDLAADQQDDGAVPWIVPRIEGQEGTAGWGDATTIVPWTLYQHYGDLRVLERAYPSMKRWVQYIDRRVGPDLIWARDFQFGDWLDYLSVTQNEAFGATPPPLVATAYYARSTNILARSAVLLGRDADAAHYAASFERIREAFVARFVGEDATVRGSSERAPSQAGYVVALDFDLLPEALRPPAAAKLAAEVRASGHLTTGFLGTPRLLPVLSRFGYNDEAYALLERRDVPSWLYPVTKGATTIWERWDGLLPDGSPKPDTDMNSFNHYLYGSVGAWLYETVAGLGLDPERPGYKHIRFAPQPGGSITRASARHLGPYGPIAIAWERYDEHFSCSVDVPPNSSATLRFPSADPARIREGGRPIASSRDIRAIVPGVDHVLIEFGSGSFAFDNEPGNDQQ
ncbi:glycoside hydrolase family 78 protein [Sphingomonas sp.]|uniref:glycoside hydrolase family 78 protein n=1 Tax=Sphingomonas sp. TaxID=28214 RepID=UPI0025FE54AE|nr:glycoside hydrolase family 78 protein [Sphingomonas sp.]